jgi:hypothetical protein
MSRRVFQDRDESEVDVTSQVTSQDRESLESRRPFDEGYFHMNYETPAVPSMNHEMADVPMEFEKFMDINASTPEPSRIQLDSAKKIDDGQHLSPPPLDRGSYCDIDMEAPGNMPPVNQPRQLSFPLQDGYSPLNSQSTVQSSVIQSRQPSKSQDACVSLEDSIDMKEPSESPTPSQSRINSRICDARKNPGGNEGKASDDVIVDFLCEV